MQLHYIQTNERTNSGSGRRLFLFLPPPSSFLLPPSFTSFLSHFSLLLSPLSPYVYLPRSPGAREAGKGASPVKKRRASRCIEGERKEKKEVEEEVVKSE